jgi:hypothetical protein
MYRFPALNRHAVGISALILLIAGLGFVGTTSLHQMRRPIALDAQPVENTTQTASAQSVNPAGWNAKFLALMDQIPLTEHRSAALQSPAQPAPSAQSAESAAQPSQGSAEQPQGSMAAATKDWTEQDWRIATQAVAEHRSAAKASMTETQAPAPVAEHRSAAESPKAWRPPEEIAHKAPANAPR